MTLFGKWHINKKSTQHTCVSELFGQTDLESRTVVAEDEHLVVLANFGSVQGEKTVFRPVQNSRVHHAFPLCVPRIKTKCLFKA